MSEQHGPYSHQPQGQPSDYQWAQTPPPPPGAYPPYVNEEVIPTQRSSTPPQAYFQPPTTPVYHVMPPPAPPSPPPMKHDRSLLIVVGMVVAVLLLVLGGIGALAITSLRTANTPATPTPVSKTQTITTNNSTQGPSETPVVSKTPINTLNQRYPIGQTVNGKLWQITANNVRTTGGDDFIKADKGKTFVLIDVVVKNVSPKPATVSSLLMFVLRGLDEVEYIESLTSFAKPPDGEVAPGATIKGTLAFEVPLAQRDFLFVFLPQPLESKEEVIWNVHVAK